MFAHDPYLLVCVSVVVLNKWFLFHQICPRGKFSKLFFLNIYFKIKPGNSEHFAISKHPKSLNLKEYLKFQNFSFQTLPFSCHLLKSNKIQQTARKLTLCYQKTRVIEFEIPKSFFFFFFLNFIFARALLRSLKSERLFDKTSLTSYCAHR